MARIAYQREDVELTEPTLVEGFPGVGLVGKILVDHLIEALEMTHYANVHCEGIPPVATYEAGSNELVTPVRLYVDTDRNLLALQSDVPIKPAAATAFANCVTEWFAETDTLPIYISGLPRQTETDDPALYGVGVGDGATQLAAAGVDSPAETGLISGPTGALLSHAIDTNTDAVGVVVESDPQFPDPVASQTVIQRVVEPLTGADIPTAGLDEKAEEIEQARTKLLQRMQQASEESSRAEPIRMYQ